MVESDVFKSKLYMKIKYFAVKRGSNLMMKLNFESNVIILPLIILFFINQTSN